MGYRASISKEAQIELGTAECFFRTKGLETAFLQDFKNQLQFLKTTPESFQVKYRGIRTICFERFNYSIHYVIITEEVIILRILNQRQDF